MTTQTKNYGFSKELEKQHQQQDDWKFGAFSPNCIADIPENERLEYFPMGEVQIGREDMMDCATRGPINILETKFTWLYRNNLIATSNRKWLEDNGYVLEGSVRFSDAFIAIKSGTTRQGNSMKAPIHAIHEWGLIPKDDLPLIKSMTFNEYHDAKRITKAMEDLGAEFKKRFPIYYERVDYTHFSEVYKSDMLVLAGHAWSEPENGEYPATDEVLNHVFVGVSKPLHIIFDNYIDSVDGDFVKKLAANYVLYEEGYRVFVTELFSPIPTSDLIPLKWNFLERIMVFIKSLFGQLKFT